jgi:integrase
MSATVNPIPNSSAHIARRRKRTFRPFFFLAVRNTAIRASATRRDPVADLPAVARARLADGTRLPEGLRFHDLRHTCVALLIEQGVHAKEIAERLGHSTVRLTLDRYAHLLPSLDERLRDGLEGAYQQALAASNGDQMGTRRGPTPLRREARKSR